LDGQIVKKASMKIATRRVLLCPSCRKELAQEFIGSARSPEVACPNCGSKMKLPSAPAREVKVENQRREKRCPATLKVTYNSFLEFKSEYTKNVSQGGMFIKTDHPHEIGSRIDVQLHSQELGEPMHIVCEVVRRETDVSGGKEQGIGVKFVDIAPESRERLMRLLKTLKDCL
jgi:type IV pilus assembly protein PilZ